MIGGVVRALFPDLCALGKRRYTLTMLVRIFAENGLRITPTALSGYMKKLDRVGEGVSGTQVRKGRTQLSTSRSEVRRHFGMKPGVSL
jgi:hypothetical protein